MFDFNSALWKMPRLAGARIASIYFLIVIAYIASSVLIVVNPKGGSHVNPIIAITIASGVLLSILAWGCIRLNKFVYWISTVLIGVDALLFLIKLPDTIRFIWDVLAMANWHEPIDSTEFHAVSFFYTAFIIGVLKIIALVILLLRSSREAFGIGKFAAHKIASHASY